MSFALSSVVSVSPCCIERTREMSIGTCCRVELTIATLTMDMMLTIVALATGILGTQGRGMLSTTASYSLITAGSLIILLDGIAICCANKVDRMIEKRDLLLASSNSSF